MKDLIRVYYHNVQSLMDKLEDIQADTIPQLADVMILAETWLDPSTVDTGLQIKDFSISLNSVGKGKGLAILFKMSKFQVVKTVKCIDIQITKLEGAMLTIIALYRSQSNITVLEYLKELIPHSGNCLIIGDMNICLQSQPSHEIFQQLKQNNFKALLCEATHLRGGHIDQAWYRGDANNCSIKMYSPYYTCKDHDAILFSQHGLLTEKGMSRIFSNLLCNVCVRR